MYIAEGRGGETEGNTCRLCGDAEGEGTVGLRDQTEEPGVCMFVWDR